MKGHSTKPVIAGIGEAAPSPIGSGRTGEAMILQAVEAACEDAGVQTSEIDAILEYSHDTSMSLQALAANLRCTELRVGMECSFGGGSPSALLRVASALVAAGTATTVLCHRSIVGAEWVRRMTLPDEVRPYYLDTVNYLRPFGWTGYLHNFASMYSQHSERYGTTRDALAHTARQLRANACNNPASACRSQLSLEEYFLSTPSIGPFNEFDDFTPGDVGCAVIVTSAAMAAARGNQGIVAEIVATSQSHNPEPMAWFDSRSLCASEDGPVRSAATELYSASGISPESVDVAHLYDCSTFTFLHVLEESGLCDRGAAADLVAEEDSLSATGIRPANTNGGDFAGGYSHGFRHILEAARQVTGRAYQQVPGAEIALVMGAPLGPTSGSLIRRLELA